MNIAWLWNALMFLVVLLVQALVLNHIHLFDCATPFLYVYMVLLFRRNYPKWAILLLSFVRGLCVDVFSNTPGMASGAMTFIGLLQPYLLLLFVNRDSPDDLQPSMKSLGVAKFVYFTVILTFVYCLLFFTLETFTFFNWLQWIECVGGSTAISVALILVVENFRKR